MVLAVRGLYLIDSRGSRISLSLFPQFADFIYMISAVRGFYLVDSRRSRILFAPNYIGNYIPNPGSISSLTPPFAYLYTLRLFICLSIHPIMWLSDEFLSTDLLISPSTTNSLTYEFT